MRRLKMRAWLALHGLVNRLAWRWGMEPGWRSGMWGCALHTRDDHWTWRLNHWVAGHWIEPWLEDARRERNGTEVR